VNVRRDLFRLWIVLALLWAVFIGSLSWEKIYSPVVAPRIYVYEPETRTFDELVRLDDVSNPRTEISFAAEKVTLVLSGNPSHAQARAIVGVFRPDHVDIRHSEVGFGRLRSIGIALLFHLIPSLLVLGVGALSVWAFAGFRPKQRDRWTDERRTKPWWDVGVWSFRDWARGRRASPDVFKRQPDG
jgi:hypothetical protein